ncbi:TIGR01777 family oxidoreductase [Paenibacillus lutimineralis]|uniref:TIGR01777 family protein n=1 Tax=Paenibacillus lutimineralis TaxID=2707005 RepID=A0A3Q9IB30_9BACL|nr:TIGR01777 family oxidoreductase [Paenibacillus lutimineralis]AZS16851.1 TIGR01777 family protein [Paenibacillus lutimineralis]
MRYAILGGSGFIGSALTEYWLSKGHEIIIVTRRNSHQQAPRNESTSRQLSYYTWNDINQDPLLLRGLDGLVNLAGATISQRWTRRAKQQIMDSRLQTTQALGRWINMLGNEAPRVIVQGSAVGIYGTSLTEEFTEHSPNSARDFLARVTTSWEETALQGILQSFSDQYAELGHEGKLANVTGPRLVLLRTGVVLGNQGGAYPMMRLPFLLGAGGRIGTGKQWVPWIHIDDLVSLIDYCVTCSEILGPVNAVSPNPVTNEQFGRAIARVHHRPFWLPLPTFALRSVLGEMSLLLLEGQRVIPQAASSSGFIFTFPHLEAALTDLKQRN